jgi:hypothetical protein
VSVVLEHCFRALSPYTRSEEQGLACAFGCVGGMMLAGLSAYSDARLRACGGFAVGDWETNS